MASRCGQSGSKALAPQVTTVRACDVFMGLSLLLIRVLVGGAPVRPGRWDWLGLVRSLAEVSEGLDQDEGVAADDCDDLGAVADQRGHVLQDVTGKVWVHW